MVSRAGDWFRQAERDLEQAEDSRQAERHEWACFAGPLQSRMAIEYAREIVEFARAQMA